VAIGGTVRQTSTGPEQSGQLQSLRRPRHAGPVGGRRPEPLRRVDQLAAFAVVTTKTELGSLGRRSSARSGRLPPSSTAPIRQAIRGRYSLRPDSRDPRILTQFTTPWTRRDPNKPKLRRSVAVSVTRDPTGRRDDRYDIHQRQARVRDRATENVLPRRIRSTSRGGRTRRFVPCTDAALTSA
jgi:hypothetical protein